MTYMPPTAGTFYVPPQYAEIVSSLPPITGDFARGVRDERLNLQIIAIPYGVEPFPQP